MINGVTEDRQFQMRGGLIGAEPFLAFVEADIQLETVRPVLAGLPFPVDLLHGDDNFPGAFDRVQHVVTVGLGKEIVDDAVTHMLAVSGAVLAEDRLHPPPNLIDQFEILVGRQLCIDLDRVLQVRHQSGPRRDIGSPVAQQIADHQIPPAEDLQQRVFSGFVQVIREEHTFPEERRIEPVSIFRREVIPKSNVGVPKLAGADRLDRGVELRQLFDLRLIQIGVHGQKIGLRHPVLGDFQVKGKEGGAVDALLT